MREYHIRLRFSVSFKIDESLFEYMDRHVDGLEDHLSSTLAESCPQLKGKLRESARQWFIDNGMSVIDEEVTA